MSSTEQGMTANEEDVVSHEGVNSFQLHVAHRRDQNVADGIAMFDDGKLLSLLSKQTVNNQLTDKCCLCLMALLPGYCFY